MSSISFNRPEGSGLNALSGPMSCINFFLSKSLPPQISWLKHFDCTVLGKEKRPSSCSSPDDDHSSQSRWCWRGSGEKEEVVVVGDGGQLGRAGGAFFVVVV